MLRCSFLGIRTGGSGSVLRVSDSAQSVLIARSEFRELEIGAQSALLRVTGSQNVVVRGNEIENSTGVRLDLRQNAGVLLDANTFRNCLSASAQPALLFSGNREELRASNNEFTNFSCPFAQNLLYVDHAHPEERALAFENNTVRGCALRAAGRYLSFALGAKDWELARITIAHNEFIAGADADVGAIGVFAQFRELEIRGNSFARFCSAHDAIVSVRSLVRGNVSITNSTVRDSCASVLDVENALELRLIAFAVFAHDARQKELVSVRSVLGRTVIADVVLRDVRALSAALALQNCGAFEFRDSEFRDLASASSERGLLLDVVNSVGGVLVRNVSATNVTAGSGGAFGCLRLEFIEGPVALEDLSFAQLRVTEGGGALSLQNIVGNTLITRARFTDVVSSEGNGGAIYATTLRGELELSACEFTNCSAVQGGALFLENLYAPARLSALLVRGARALQGGALFLSQISSRVELRDSEFEGVRADYGGVAYVQDSQLSAGQLLVLANNSVRDCAVALTGCILFGENVRAITVRDLRALDVSGYAFQLESV